MSYTHGASNERPEVGLSSAPAGFSVSARGFESEDYARAIAQCVAHTVNEMGRYFDLSHLDGVTVAYDYGQALLDLDRGYETSHQLTASDGHAVGVAMTPSVLRDGALKSHIVLNAHVVAAIEDSEHEGFPLALHVIAHECAHAEITARFEEAFPGRLLRERFSDHMVAYRWQVVQVVWDEYAATRLSAGIGADPTDGYEDTFLTYLAEARDVANNHIRQYRTHANVNQLLPAVYGTYGDLLKFTAYHLGNLSGLGIAVTDRPRTIEGLAGHWFAPYFFRLDEACTAVFEGYGRWSDQALFQAIGDIANDVVNLGGLLFRYPQPGQLYVDVPFTADTMPRQAEVQVNK